MAKDDGYQSALDSIFGFIFSNNKSDSKPLRPAKPTGLNPSNDMAGALAELASKPATYLPEQTLERVNDFIDADLLRYELLDHKDKDKGALRIRTKDLGKILADPNSFFDKQVKETLQKGNSSIMDLITGGALIDQAIGYGIAKHKLGVDEDTAQSIGWFTGNRLEMNTEGAMRSKGWKMMAENAIAAKATQGVISKAKAKSLISSIRRDTTVRYNEKQLETLLNSAGLGAAADSILEGYKDEFEDKYNKYFDKGMLSRVGFGSLLSQNLLRRQDLETGTAQENLRKAQILVDTWQKAQITGKGDFPKFERSLGDIDSNITALRRSQDPDDRMTLTGLLKAKKELEGLIEENQKVSERLPFWALPDHKNIMNTKRINKALRSDLKARGYILEKALRDATASGDRDRMRKLNIELNEHKFEQRSLLAAPPGSFVYALGRYRKYSAYIKDTLKGGKGGMLPGGVFFSTAANEGALGEHSGYNIHLRGANGIEKRYWGGIIVPREDINHYVAELTSLQYLTPGSITKTLLLNGEAFVYLAGRHQRNFILAAKKNSALMDMIKTDARFSNIWLGEDGNPINFDKPGAIDGAMGNNFLELLDLLESDPRWGAALGIADLKKKYESMGKLAFRFSAPQRLLMDPWQEWVKKNIKEKLDDFIRDRLLLLFESSKWRDSVESFISRKMGLRQLIQTGLSTALGSLSGPLGLIASYVITESVMKAIPGLISGIMKTIVLIIWGVVFLVFGIGAMVMQFGSTGSNTNAWNHRFPEPIETLAGENPYGPEIKDGLDYKGPSLKDAPAGSTCPVLGSVLSCMQGPEGGFTHAAMGTGAIDISARGIDPVWYAPTNGTVTSYSASNYCSDGKDYGGVLYFADSEGNSYRLIHVQAVVSSGKVAKGKPVAILRFDIEDGRCFSGAHFHLDTRVGGGWVNSEEWYRDKLGCNVSACSN